MNNAIDITNGSLDGQVAIVTGGSVGIGLSTAIAVGRAGANVVVVGRNKTRLDEALTEIEHKAVGCECLGLALDVRQETDMQQMALRSCNTR